VIVECNAWTLPQERYNARWILDKEVGLVLRSFRHVDRAVAKLIEPATLARYRANAAALENRAVFEIPGILETILSRSQLAADNTVLTGLPQPGRALRSVGAPRILPKLNGLLCI